MSRMGRGKLAIAVAGGLVVLLIGAVVTERWWVRSRDYLEPGSTSQVPAGARVESAGNVAVVPYRQGARVAYGISIRNRGPLSVTVTEVARPSTSGESVFRPVEVRMARRERGGTRADLQFVPFTLDPGQERYVEVVGELGACRAYDPGRVYRIASQRVRFEVFREALSADVKLPTPIEWRFGPDTPCPA